MRVGDDKCVVELPEEAASGCVKHRELDHQVSLEENSGDKRCGEINTGGEYEDQEREGIKNVAHGSVSCLFKS